MRKKTIAILFSLAFGIGLVGVITTVIGSVILSSICSPHCGSPDFPTPIGPLITVLIGLLIILVGLVLGIISWIGTLVKQALQRQWAWFTCTLALGILLPLISSIGQLVYLIAVPETPPPVAPDYVLGYQPHPSTTPYPPAQPYPPVIQYPPAQQHQPMSPYPPQE